MFNRLRNTHSVANFCSMLNVARSGYQAWSRDKVLPARKWEDARLLAAIRAAHERGRGIYGPKKI